MTSATKPATSFWIIGVLALLWNLSGVMSFFMDGFMSEEALSKLTDEQRALHESYPTLLLIIYGTAVFSGAIACITLLMRKKIAVQLFIISFVAALIQMSYGFIATNSVDAYGTIALIMPIVVLVFGILLIVYSRNVARKGWIA